MFNACKVSAARTAPEMPLQRPPLRPRRTLHIGLQCGIDPASNKRVRRVLSGGRCRRRFGGRCGRQKPCTGTQQNTRVLRVAETLHGDTAKNSGRPFLCDAGVLFACPGRAIYAYDEYLSLRKNFTWTPSDIPALSEMSRVSHTH